MESSSRPSPAELTARFDRIPIWPWKRSMLVFIGFGFFFSFFDIITIATSLSVMSAQFGVDENTVNWAVTTSLIGYIFGSFIDSRIADRYGRRIGLYISVGLFSVGSILTATSWEFWMVLFWRFVSGMGIGAEIAGVTTYMGEMSPRRGRGRYTGWAILCGFVGFAVVPFVALLLVPNYEWGWRALFVIGGAGGIVIFFMRRNMPDSPRWLIVRGRLDEANQMIEQVEEDARAKLDRELPPPDPVDPLGSGGVEGIRSLLKRPYLSQLVFFGLVWAFYYTGNYAWLELSDELLVDKGFAVASSLWLTGIASVGFIVGSFIAIWISDRLERKWSSSIIALIWSILLLLIGWFPSGPMIMVAGFLAAVSISLIIPLIYTYTAESFPTSVRATGVSITDGLGHVGGALCPQIVFGLSALLAPSEYQFEVALSVMAATGLCTAVILTFGRRTHDHVL